MREREGGREAEGGGGEGREKRREGERGKREKRGERGKEIDTLLSLWHPRRERDDEQTRLCSLLSPLHLIVDAVTRCLFPLSPALSLSPSLTLLPAPQQETFAPQDIN